MKPLPLWFRFVMRVASIVPPLGSALGWRLFWQLGAPASVRDSEREFHDSARVSRDGDIVSYAWGDGSQTVLLVHGWRSRASRFAAIGAALVEQGYTVVSFDARGNGASGGTRTHALEYAEIVRQLGQRYGAFEAIIAHSLGVVAASIAMRRGTRARRLVTIGAPHDFDSVLRTFTTAVGMPPAASRSLKSRINRWARPLGVDVWRELVTELDPTASRPPCSWCTTRATARRRSSRRCSSSRRTPAPSKHSSPTDSVTTGCSATRQSSSASPASSRRPCARPSAATAPARPRDSPSHSPSPRTGRGRTPENTEPSRCLRRFRSAPRTHPRRGSTATTAAKIRRAAPTR